MWIPIFGLLIGILLGVFCPLNIFLINTNFLSIVVLSAIDSILLAYNAKIDEEFDTFYFTNLFILNTILAVGLVYFGNIMNINLFMALAVVFIARIFYSLAQLNKKLIQGYERNSVS